MPDTRFFETLGPISIGEIAALAGAVIDDANQADRLIEGVSPLAEAGPLTVGFLNDRRYLDDFLASRAGACFMTPAMAEQAPQLCVKLITGEPQVAYAKTANRLHKPITHPADTPQIHPHATLEEGVRLAPGVVIGPGARVGAGTEIGANAVIGPGVTIGRHCCIGANATIGFALMGDRVHVMSGAVIGQAGFGVAAGSAGSMDFPQLGRVILQDEVTIGACTCVDRGAFGDTVIGERTKIDNLVQIAHNVVIGRDCVIAAQTGLSGSVVVGDGVQLGGKSGSGDHLTIHAGARLAAGALTMRDVPPGETWCGVPARPIRRFMRELAWVTQSIDKSKSRGGKDGDG